MNRCVTAHLATAAMLLAPATAEAQPAEPPGVTTSYLVVDAHSGQTRQHRDEHQRFRSASLVKLLIALDYLESRAPGDVPRADRDLLEPMLRASDDDAASTLWVRGGQPGIIQRTTERIGLADTAPPDDPGMWGYTAISASDVARIYGYILHGTRPDVRAFMMHNLHHYTDCAADGFDQSFGLPSAIDGDLAIKQGWSGFGATPDEPCRTGQPPETPEVTRARDVAPGEADAQHRSATGASSVDLKRRAMHTSGIVDHDTIMVVLTLQQEGTSWEDAADWTTAMSEVLHRAAD